MQENIPSRYVSPDVSEVMTFFWFSNVDSLNAFNVVFSDKGAPRSHENLKHQQAKKDVLMIGAQAAPR